MGQGGQSQSGSGFLARIARTAERLTDEHTVAIAAIHGAPSDPGSVVNLGTATGPGAPVGAVPDVAGADVATASGAGASTSVAPTPSDVPATPVVTLPSAVGQAVADASEDVKLLRAQLESVVTNFRNLFDAHASKLEAFEQHISTLATLRTDLDKVVAEVADHATALEALVAAFEKL